jgi:hypothetical protein
LPGDVVNVPDLHTMLYAGETDAGQLAFFEANRAYERVHLRLTDPSELVADDYTPLRFDHIEDGTPRGSPDAPREVDANPFYETFWLVEGPSRALDAYACAPGDDRSGPEVLYRVRLDAPGRLRGRVADDAGGDMALFLLSAADPATCLSWTEAELAPIPLEAGEWWLAVEPRVTDGVATPGAFALSVYVDSDAPPEAEPAPGAPVADSPARTGAPPDGCGCGGAGAPVGAWMLAVALGIRRRPARPPG